ncbi:MAG TPA: flagellar basal body-associated FliL family protein [Hyphomonas sp.]|nr:flagellar basal body-associated FliL family protein [Hyphomonas sp.]
MAGKKGDKADKAPKAEDAEADAKKGGGGGVVGLAVLAVGALASSFATVYFLTPSSHSAETVACTPGEAPPAIQPAIKDNQAYVELRDLTVTIGSEPATRYLKIKIAVITNNKETGAVSKAEPVLIDAFTNYLRSVELSDFENPGFYAHMREQLSRRSQLVLGSDVSDGVLITEFLLR